MNSNLPEAFKLLFLEMTILSATFLIIGLALVVMEIFISTKLLMGGLGVLALAVGVVTRMLNNGSLPMLFLMLFFIFLIINCSYFFMIFMYKQGWLSRAPVIQKESSETNKDYYFLLNLEGIAMTDIIYAGKIEINEIELEVQGIGKLIPRNSRVRVIEVEGRKIIVKQVQASEK